MKPYLMPSLAIMFLLSAAHPLYAELIIYDAPDGAPANNTYTVAVREAQGAWKNLFVYDSVVCAKAKEHMAFVYFDSDFSRPVEISITRNSGTVKSVRVRPKSKKINPACQGNTAVVTMTSPVKLSVEFDNDIFHNIFIFANPKETDPVNKTQQGLVYYGPGVHNVGGNGEGGIPISDGTTVYIAGGAIVYGHAFLQNVHNVTIRGRGILCGSKMNHEMGKPRTQMVSLLNVSNFTMEGIIILDGPAWNVVLEQTSSLTIKNVKILAWNYNSDGINPKGCQNLLVDDCFIRNFDDCSSIKLNNFKHNKPLSRNSNITFINCTLWADIGHPLLIGPEASNADEANHITEKIRYKNIDILRSADPYDTFFGALAIMASDNQIIRDVVYEDIRVDPLGNGNLINIRFLNNAYANDYAKRVENIIFKNITLEGPNKFPNRILGHSEDRAVDGVTIENLVIDNKLVTNAADGGFEINQFVHNLKFVPNNSPMNPK